MSNKAEYTTEATKAVVYPQGEIEFGGVKGYKYLVCAVIVTTEPLNKTDDGGIVLMGDSQGKLIQGLNDLTVYENPYPGYRIEQALVAVSHNVPADLKKLK